ncbi:hypothetical protein ACIRG5_25105 [Lentzea sp. NPDC102401]|uniref:hypothetical protein n=1 Tax=Lentzea sp. NPDC102401 TaxID=3364128 RepID=UPI0037FD4594
MITREAARVALDALGAHRADVRRLNVRCSRSHHVAGVYVTSAGLVYASRIGPHSHGSKDRVDEPHHGASHGTEVVEPLEADSLADDSLPASCACGPRVLSRAGLLRALAQDRRRLDVL